MQVVQVKLLILAGILLGFRLLFTFVTFTPEKARRRFCDFCDMGLIACVVSFVLASYVFQLSYVDGDSMLPSLRNGEYTIVNKLVYRFHAPQRGDIVVFQAPDEEDKDYIKRVIALPGETLSIENGWVIVKGLKVNEPYLLNRPDRPYSEIKLKPNELFVMGDNRQNSTDSRVFGGLDRGRILGKASFIIWPPNRWGFIKSFQGRRFLGRNAG
jgi:signal peptidase I